MTQHTSGPWRVGSNGASVKVVDTADKAICMLTPRRDMWNGDLIASAPALLAAAQAAHALLTDPDADEFAANRVEALLAGAITAALGGA